MKCDEKYFSLKNQKSRYMIFFSVLVFITAGIDQICKYKIAQILKPGEVIPILPFFSLWHVHNAGIAFSFLSSFKNKSIIFFICSILLLMFWLLWDTDPKGKLLWIGYSFVFGGAFGNLADRIHFAYVVDYFLFHGKNWSFAVFNLADVFITCGSICIFIEETRNVYIKKLRL